MGRTFRNVCIVVGVLSIFADVATMPTATVGTTYCGSSGAAFCPLLPYGLPILSIIGVVVGFASITMAFASERGASVISGVAAGFALTFGSSVGSWTYSHMDVGWPLPWAHQFTSLSISFQPYFYVDVAGLVLDIVFWAAVVFIVLSLFRLLLPRRTGSSPVTNNIQTTGPPMPDSGLSGTCESRVAHFLTQLTNCPQ